jgi:hypothetical protein
VRQHLVSTPNVGNDDDLYRSQRAKVTTIRCNAALFLYFFQTDPFLGLYQSTD